MEDGIDQILRAQRLGSSDFDDEPVGSHRDLNAHNVLFTAEGLVLIDWDGAGSTYASFERASTAMLWSQRNDGSLDLARAVGFLRAYRDAGGMVCVDDPAALYGWLNGLAWWTERNLQIAITDPSSKHDELACHLVKALAGGVETVQSRAACLADAIARL